MCWNFGFPRHCYVVFDCLASTMYLVILFARGTLFMDAKIGLEC